MKQQETYIKNQLLKKVFYKTIVRNINIVSQSKKHLLKTKKAIDLIFKIDPSFFDKEKILKVILIYPGNTEIGCIFERERIYVNQPKHINQSSVLWWASTIMHESWHVHQFNYSPMITNGRAEYGAYRIQRKFLEKLKAWYEIRWLDKMQKEKWWKSEKTLFKKGVGYDAESRNAMQLKFEKFVYLYMHNKLHIQTIESR